MSPLFCRPERFLDLRGRRESIRWEVLLCTRRSAVSSARLLGGTDRGANNSAPNEVVSVSKRRAFRPSCQRVCNTDVHSRALRTSSQDGSSHSAVANKIANEWHVEPYREARS